jgi:2'-5' RNA ligase
VDLAGLLDLEGLFASVRGIDGGIKTVEPENVHLTLKFLGDTPSSKVADIEAIMKDAVKEASPFSLEFKGVGAFPKRDHVKVLWIGVDGEVGVRTMADIAQRIDRDISRLGYQREKRRFSPHLTVARVKFVRDKTAMRAIFDDFEGMYFGKVDVGSIRLKKSVLGPQGPSYSTVLDVKLGRGQ